MANRPELSPTLKPLQVGALSLGCIIGFGCFVLPGDFLATAGPLGAVLGVLLGGAAMLIIARSYGVMVRAFPVAGAEFAYAYHACGRYHAYVCGWFLALGYLSIVPLNATALAVLGKFIAPQVFARGYLYTVAGFEVFAGDQCFVFLATHLVNGLAKVLGNMEFIKGNLLLRPRQAFQCGIDKGRPHIHGNTLNGFPLLFCQTVIPRFERRLFAVASHVQH